MQPCQNHEKCIHTALETAEHICRDKGLRFTELRRKVLQMVWASHGPAKAYEILAKLSLEDPKAKPPTVYRTLDFLLENGFIHKLQSLNAYVGCSHPLEKRQCYFLICDHCGDIEECCNVVLNEALVNTTKASRFHLTNVTLEISGECESCVKNAKKV
ncbi:MAG: Fur family transcriptional regulator [Pseudomonadota bacterium]